MLWVSQKWWMLELSNLCHCVQHPWKLTRRDFWSSGNAPNTPWHPLHPLMPPWHPKWPPHWFPRGSDLPDQNQLFVNMWHYLQWLFTNMYIHNLITYSCTKSKKCYEDCFYTWPINSYPSINNLVYYYTKVLLSFIHSLLWCSMKDLLPGTVTI